MAYELNRDGLPEVNTPIKDLFLENPDLSDVIDSRYEWRGNGRALESVTLRLDRATPAQVVIMHEMAKARNEKRLASLLHGCIAYREKAPNFAAGYFMMLRFLRESLTADGWLYRKTEDGRMLPYVVTRIHRREPDDRDKRDGDRPSFTFRLDALSPSKSADEGNYGGGQAMVNIEFGTSEITYKTPEQALNMEGFYVETPELRAEYDAWHAYHNEHVAGQFAEQFRLDRRDNGEPGAKVILDTKNGTLHEVSDRHDTSPLVIDPETGKPGRICPIPVHLFVRVFRLDNHRFERVNSSRLTRYAYNPTLADKLILPESHTNILNVLTSNTAAYLSDIIEGKSAGNVILCMGSPGVGKTLTAEVYAEIVKRPLYNLHSGELGTTPSSVEKEIQTVFKRVKAWNCVLLLDEADVFVRERGFDLNQNAVVSVFLRVLEYSEALMFMTTNLAESIDDAIISRCAAIIRYTNPTREDRAAIWRVMAENNKANLPEDLLPALVDTFPSASPRDIKHLLRLALRVSEGMNLPVNLDLFRMIGAFRAVEIKTVDAAMSKPLPRVRMRPQRAQEAV